MSRKYLSASTASLLLLLFTSSPYVVSKNASKDSLATSAILRAATSVCEKTSEQPDLLCSDTSVGDVHLSDANSTESEKHVHLEPEKSFIFPLHPSPTDPDGIPHRWLAMAKNNRQVALQAFRATLAWREQHDIDTILSRPNVRFDQVKAIFPHFFAGRDVQGNVVFVQRPGIMQLHLKSELNVTSEEMYYHVIYVLEYCWNILEPGPNSTMTSVVDLSGVSFSMLQNFDLMSFVKDIVSTSSLHYPSRSFKTLIINAPRWFGVLFNILKPLMRESTRQKIEIYTGGKTQDKALLRVLGDSFPKELMSTYSNAGDKSIDNTTYGFGVDSIPERQLRDFCADAIEHAREKMLPVN